MQQELAAKGAADAIAFHQERFKALEAEFQAAKMQHAAMLAATRRELTAAPHRADGLEEQLRNGQGEPADDSKQVRAVWLCWLVG